MTPNPLDSIGQAVLIELMNPNVRASKTKNGMTYRVSFELAPDDWQLFADANTAGMILEAEVSVIQSGSFIEPLTQEADKNPSILPSTPDKKGGLLSQWAAMRCNDEVFKTWLMEAYVLIAEPDAALCRTIILEACGIESRAELDSNPRAAQIFHDKFRKPFSEWIIDRCKKCGGAMIDGQYIEQTLDGEPDFPGGEVVTLSPSGPGKISQCRKCVKCGWSVT